MVRLARLNEGKKGMNERQEAISLLAETKEEETVDLRLYPPGSLRHPQASVSLVTFLLFFVFNFQLSCYYLITVEVASRSFQVPPCYPFP